MLQGAPPATNGLGIGLCGPAIIHHGSEAQKKRFLRPMLRAEEMWCQGYSEPGAGSDLANLRTTAELRGDKYLVNGQKIWTSARRTAPTGSSAWCAPIPRPTSTRASASS